MSTSSDDRARALFHQIEKILEPHMIDPAQWAPYARQVIADLLGEDEVIWSELIAPSELPVKAARLSVVTTSSVIDVDFQNIERGGVPIVKAKRCALAIAELELQMVGLGHTFANVEFIDGRSRRFPEDDRETLDSDAGRALIAALRAKVS